MIETSWAQTLYEDLESDTSHKFASDDLVNVLTNLSGMVVGKPVVAADIPMEVGDPIPDTDAPLGDFSPAATGGM